MEPDPSHIPPEAEPRPSTEPSSNGHDPSVGEALKQARAHLGELKEYASLYVAAKIDSLKLTVRGIVLYAVLGVVGAIVGLGLLLTAAALLLTGLAGGIGKLFNPDQWWAGALIVGVVVLAVAIGGVMLVIRRLTGASRKLTLQKYEDRRRQERVLYGHDVQERAREQQAQRQAKE